MQPYSRYAQPSMQQGLDIEAIIASLEVDLDPIVRAQISQLVNQIIDSN